MRSLTEFLNFRAGKLHQQAQVSKEVSSDSKPYNSCSKGAEYGGYDRDSINSDSQVNVGALSRPLFRAGMSPTKLATTIIDAIKFEGRRVQPNRKKYPLMLGDVTCQYLLHNTESISYRDAEARSAPDRKGGFKLGNDIVGGSRGG